MRGSRLSPAMRAGPRTAIAVSILLVPALIGPVAAQAPDTGGRFVPESMWGVKDDVGLGLVREFLTNYGDRSFWEARPTGEDVTVAVIDTGISLEHPDLDGVLACDHCWRDFVNERAAPYDDNGHGTHVSTIIAGDGHLQANPLNGYFPTGARGIATGAELIVAKAMNESGGGSDARVADSIRWAIDPDGQPGSGDEPDILHLSLGVRAPTADDGEVRTGSNTEEAVQAAVERGIVVVMSAGNQGAEGPAPPGNVDGVIAVGGLTADHELLPFSNHGRGVDVFAPGVILSAWPRNLDDDGITDAYTGLAGTSQAAPVVTGALALALEASGRSETDGGATMVHHLASMVRSTSERVNTTTGTVRVLDANALVASQDRGTDDWAVGVVVTLAIITLLVAYGVGRAGWRALGRFVESQDDADPLEPAPPDPPTETPDEPSEPTPETTTDDPTEEPRREPGALFRQRED